MGSSGAISKRTASYSALTYLGLFGLAIAVPLLLLLGALLFQSLSAQREQLERRGLQVLQALVNDIDRDLDRDLTILRTLATSQALAISDWRTFHSQAQAALQGRAYLVLIDTNGRQLVNTYVPYGEQPAMTSDPETLRRIVQTNAPVVSNLFTSVAVKGPAFSVSIPLLRDDRLLVMSLGLLPSDLVSLLAAQKFGSEWVTTIWDANGVILARSRDNDRYLGTSVPANMREQDRQSTVRTTNLDGTDVLHATARSRISGWGVGVNLPYALISEQIRNSLLLWGAVAVLAVTVALTLGLTFARQITTSLSIASKAAAAFGRGESFPIVSSRLREADAFLATLATAREELSTAQRHQILLMRESHHRTQNLFAVVQSVISRSLVEGQTAAQAKQVITGRLEALARTHAILGGTAWEGASLGEIIRREFGEDFAGYVDVSGCDIVVSGGAAHQFALIIHELTTNALKYGALSVPSGRVSIIGNIEHVNGASRFSLAWRETGGPPVVEPTRKGFGSVILLDAARRFGMDIDVKYHPAGLSYELHVSTRDIAPSKPSNEDVPYEFART
jgi:two-component sensor histidine kinase